MAFTLGHTVFGQTDAALDISRDHELVHVRQAAQRLVAVSPLELSKWADAFRDVAGLLTAPLADICRDRNRPESERMVATTLLAGVGGLGTFTIAKSASSVGPETESKIEAGTTIAHSS